MGDRRGLENERTPSSTTTQDTDRNQRR